MRMPDVGFSVEVIRGVPVVATPEDVDINNAAGLRGRPRVSRLPR